MEPQGSIPGLPIADRQNTGVWAHRGAAVVVVMYPEVRAVLPELDDDVPESYGSTTSRTCWSPNSPG